MYQDGIQQRLVACAHDMVQLRDEVRSTLQQLQVHTDDTLSVQIDGQLQNFRYRDGWEQEVVSLP